YAFGSQPSPHQRRCNHADLLRHSSIRSRGGFALRGAPGGVSAPVDLEPSALLALVRERSERVRTGRFLVEGSRFVHCARSLGLPIAGLVHAPEILRDPSGQRLVRIVKREGIPTRRLTADEFGALSLLDDPQGIAVVLPMVWGSLHAPFRPARSLWLGV